MADEETGVCVSQRTDLFVCVAFTLFWDLTLQCFRPHATPRSGVRDQSRVVYTDLASVSFSPFPENLSAFKRRIGDLVFGLASLYL